jgi:copper(I)-binding protein
MPSGQMTMPTAGFHEDIEMHKTLCFAAALLLAASGPTLAQSDATPAPDTHNHDMPAMTADPLAPVSIGDIEITDAFTRATLPNAPVAGGYLTITNKGKAEDSLLSATSPAAGKVELHQMSMQGDVMKMAPLPDGIVVPAGETVELSPGGLHIMFMQLKRPFVEGETVPVTLDFEKAGTVEVQLPVGGIGADAPDAMPDMKM